MARTTPDCQLIAASAQAPGKFAKIFDRHFDAVFAYLQRRIGRDLAEELAAEIFLVAFDNRGGYDSTRSDALDASGERAGARDWPLTREIARQGVAAYFIEYSGEVMPSGRWGLQCREYR